jgi:hypothetical protein
VTQQVNAELKVAALHQVTADLTFAIPQLKTANLAQDQMGKVKLETVPKSLHQMIRG